MKIPSFFPRSWVAGWVLHWTPPFWEGSKFSFLRLKKIQCKCRTVISDSKSLRELLVSGSRLNSLFPEQIHSMVWLFCVLIAAVSLQHSHLHCWPSQAGIKALGAAQPLGQGKRTLPAPHCQSWRFTSTCTSKYPSGNPELHLVTSGENKESCYIQTVIVHAALWIYFFKFSTCAPAKRDLLDRKQQE